MMVKTKNQDIVVLYLSTILTCVTIIATLCDLMQLKVYLYAASYMFFVSYLFLHYKLNSYEFLFGIFFVLYSYAYIFDTYVSTSQRIDPDYFSKEIISTDAVVSQIVFLFYQFYFFYINKKQLYSTSISNLKKSVSFYLIVIVIIAIVLNIGYIFSHISFLGYLALNKIEKAAYVMPLISYGNLTVLLLLISYFSDITPKIKKLIYIFASAVIAFDIVSGQRETFIFIVVGLLLASFKRGHEIKKFKTVSWLVVLFLGLSYLKFIYPYLSYYFLGRETHFEIDINRYRDAIFFNGEFVSNSILFYKVSEFTREGLYHSYDFINYIIKFFPLSDNIFNVEYKSVGAVAQKILGVWSGAASSPYQYIYFKYGLTGLIVFFFFFFLTIELFRRIFYRTKSFFIILFVLVSSPFILFSVHRNEFFALYKAIYMNAIIVLLFVYIPYNFLLFFGNLRGILSRRKKVL